MRRTAVFSPWQAVGDREHPHRLFAGLLRYAKVGSCSPTSDTCVYPTPSQSCGSPAQCSSDYGTVNANACDGKGNCVSTKQTCDSGCYCNAEALECVPKQTSGICSYNAQCSSNNCSSGICCDSGLVSCGSACVNTDTDSNNCGGCGAAHACSSNQTCSSGFCVCALSAASPCGGCLSWDFEAANSPSPWLIDWPEGYSQGTNGATNLQIAHSTVHGGSSSLGASIFIDYVNSWTATVAVPACPTGGTVNLAGYTFSAWAYLSGPEFTSAMDAIFLETWGPSGRGDSYPLLWNSTPIPIGSWFHVTHQLTSSILVNRIGLSIGSNDGWRGTMYIDDVLVTGL